jgi:hypothetical protein
MSFNFLLRSIQELKGQFSLIKNLCNTNISVAYNKMSSAITIVKSQVDTLSSSVSGFDGRITAVEGLGASVSSINGRVTAIEGMSVSNVSSIVATPTIALSSTEHTTDEASVWTDGADGTIVRLLGDNSTFSTLALPTGEDSGKFYVLTNTSSTSNHHIHLTFSGSTKYTLQPLETATLVWNGVTWTGIMGCVPKINVVYTLSTTQL